MNESECAGDRLIRHIFICPRPGIYSSARNTRDFSRGIRAQNGNSLYRSIPAGGLEHKSTAGQKKNGKTGGAFHAGKKDHLQTVRR